MIKDLNGTLSVGVKGMKRSAIRELLKLVSRPEIISFAGGLPAPDSFPRLELKQIMMDLMDDEKEASTAMQYGPTEGDILLREQLVSRYKKQGLDITTENLIITTASQQALDLVAKIFVNRGDTVIVGLPSYLGGLSAFNSYGAHSVGIPLDEEGMSAVLLEQKLEVLKIQGVKPKFIYVIPDFQNPAGITMSEKRRKEIIAIAHKFNILLLEDSPYRELRFTGEHQKTMFELDGTGHVILLGTFSKLFVPGFRIGWVIAHPDIVDKFVVAKQATDLCTPPFNQRIAARFLEKGLLDVNIRKIIKMYSKKQRTVLDLFEELMPEEVQWTKPEGGLFLMVTLPERIDTTDLLGKAIKEENVAFVAGQSFYCDGTGTNTMRINYSYGSNEKNIEGIHRLVKLLKREL
ncbi:MAG: PLP-dependent aminotransferase family protein [Candidatus Zophobacter franzmannii]|nr:PLP-dependent aminotransferase family protein [Candidatus Zophobacter franzmannii]